ncbi:uncharacterized protein LOC122562364 [Chiloscyllium plagiosum]|uniref:uncharacterized protein LOC122562364 n=1 Tax=Chiloscyllium plagiosum TaxID=36176 RepID=UPI001CB7EDDB|nr:uncharacterized protein LOC122562364 [Chiloscyllium plagiosum]
MGDGAVLLQEDDNVIEQPVGDFSKKLNTHQRKYSTIKKELQSLIPQLDVIWRSVRWIPDVLHYARYKHSSGGLPITWFIGFPEETPQEKDSTSSHLDDPPSQSSSPENQQRKVQSGSQPCSDDDACSEVFLPTDSDYDSSDPLSPRELQSSPAPFRNPGSCRLSGSAPDVLQVNELRLKGDCEQLSSFRGVSEPASDCSQDLTRGTVNKVCMGKAPTNTRSVSETQPRVPRYQKHRHFNQNKWLCFHPEPECLSLSLGVYKHRPEPELSSSKSPCLAQDLSIAESTRISLEESKSSDGGIMMDLSQKDSSQEESSTLSLSICSPQSQGAELTDLETDCDALGDTQGSDVVSSVL